LSNAACFASFCPHSLLENTGKEAHLAVTIKARFKSICRRLRTDADKGSAALEFAMVAPVFLLLLMATIETGVMFFAQSTLQNAVNDAARLVRTGQTACFTKDSGNKCKPMTEDQFRSQVCSEAGVLLRNCGRDGDGPTDMQFDVKAYASFTGVTNSSPLDAGKNLPDMKGAFNVGNACDVVLVRAFYKWPVFTPGLNFLLANVNGSYHLLSTAAAFRNEPYTNSVAGC
jgi:Flp pilus assembly protein TadG